jgi:hypothetical protein
MSKTAKPNWLALVLAGIAFTFAAGSYATAQAQYKVGDRVECEITGTLPGKHWMKGTITPFAPNDFGPGGEPDGSWFHFKADANSVEYPCKPEHIRALAGAKAVTKAPVKPTEETPQEVAEDQDEAPAAGDFLDCPITQKQVRNGARPDAELVKKLIRCSRAEKADPKGEGSVKVDVASVQIGTGRPWSYSQDIGNVKPGSMVYPVKATFTVSTIYHAATDVQMNWIRIINVYVNAFGEWQTGSEELVKNPTYKRIEH